MIYPVFIMIMGIGTALLVTFFVMPSLERLFDSFGAQLPLSTKLLLALTGFLSKYILYIITIGFLVILLIVWYIQRPGGRYLMERIIWKLPIVRRISVLRSIHNLCRVMSILISAGLSMIEVLKIAEQSAHSEMVRRALKKVPERLFQGQSLSQAMKADALFPSVLTQMVMLGENTNSLDNSFATMADHYEFEFNESVTSFTSMLEPALMLIVGLGIAFVAVSVIMPIYSVYSLL